MKDNMFDYYLDLFHGIGGFALGAYWAGMKFKKHYCSDIEPYCQKLYALRFPESIQLGDITKIETDKLPKGDWIITGGFPCQDISIAGKGAGIHGARSGLWFEYWRLIRDLRPRFAIMENVGMLIHRGLREVLGSLAEIGYDAEWQDIRASDMGAPHRRERIWIIAYPMPAGKRREPWEKEIESDIVADAGSNGLQESTCPEFGSVYGQVEKSKRSKSSGGIATTRGNWSTEPAVGRLAHGVPNRVDKLRGLGNAIVPQIAEILFNRIAATDGGGPDR